MFAIYAKGLQQRWIGGDLCSATDAQRFVHTRHEKEQPHMRMLDDILQRVDLVVSRAVGNQPGSVCPTPPRTPGDHLWERYPPAHWHRRSYRDLTWELVFF